MPPATKKTEAAPAKEVSVNDALKVIAYQLDDLPEKIADAISKRRAADRAANLDDDLATLSDKLPAFLAQLPAMLDEVMPMFADAQAAEANKATTTQGESVRQPDPIVPAEPTPDYDAQSATGNDGVTVTPDSEPAKPNVADTPELTVEPDNS